jgi:hypothetical protein
VTRVSALSHDVRVACCLRWLNRSPDQITAGTLLDQVGPTRETTWENHPLLSISGTIRLEGIAMSPRAKRLVSALGGILAAISAVLLCAPPGIAAIGQSSVPDWIVSLPLAQSRAEVQQVIDYWKPERLKKASSYTPSRVAASANTPAPKTTPTRTSTSTHGTASGKAVRVRPTQGKATLKSALPATVGKVFFKLDGEEYWCSASAVHSPNKNLVATAGHCAYDYRHARAVEDWIFIPGYTRDGATDYGIYVGHTLNLHQSFASLGDFDYDYAFVTVTRGFRWQADKDAKGQPKKDAAGNVAYEAVDDGRLEDNVGGQGVLWNQKLAKATYAFGYPEGPEPDGTRPYNGTAMKWCYDKHRTTMSAPPWLLNRGILVKCKFTSGASGGPWLVLYNSSTRSGYLNGVNSLNWQMNGNKRYDHVSSPYFNTATYMIYKHAAQQSTG